MKGTKYILPFIALLLTGCGSNNSGSNTSSSGSFYDPKDCLVSPLSVNYIGIASGDIQVISPDPSSTFTSVSPFNTSISGSLYYVKGGYSEEEISEMRKVFSYDFQYYHALSDRHYDYRKAVEKDDRGNATKYEVINNVKTINDSYGTGEWIEVEPYLYDLLKMNYDFTVLSGGRFNMFVGSLNDLYDEYLTSNRVFKQYMTGKNAALSVANNIFFGEDLEPERVKKCVDSIPHTESEFKDILEFDEENCKVKFNLFSRADQNEIKVSISLGGSAKGYATDRVAEDLETRYPGVNLLINSGSSSIKTIGRRPDGKSWRITYSNPLYHETFAYSPQYNMSEVYLEVPESFNLSTSGYYEQYFYVDKGDHYERRNHIVDARTGYSKNAFDEVSVYLPFAGFADMFTTALMNCDDEREAKREFDSWCASYGFENSGLILAGKRTADGEVYEYSPSDFNELSPSGYPIVKTKNSDRYTGDFSAVKGEDILSSVSVLNRQFKEVFYHNEVLASKLKLFTEKNNTYFMNPDNTYSVLKQI